MKKGSRNSKTRSDGDESLTRNAQVIAAEVDRVAEKKLLTSIKGSLDRLQKLLEECRSHWEYEDPIYRFYHHSFKVYAVQRTTETVVAALQALTPESTLNEEFLKIVSEGTGKTFSTAVNRDWTRSTRPLLEAFFHARFFLEMVIEYGRSLDEPPSPLPSGWAAVLYLYRLR